MNIEIYIHIPFCVKKCAYCDFLSGPSKAEEREGYVDLLCREIESCPDKVSQYTVTSIFLGGGTPSLLSGEQVSKIMETLKRKFVIAKGAEITLEMNPGTVSTEKLSVYRQAGVNRLSIGLQSIHDNELKMLGRIHTYEEFLEAFQMARSNGFQNINVDLISAIPGQTVKSWEETIRTIAALNPEHISAYSLIIEPGTLFYDMYGEEDGTLQAELPGEDEEREIYWRTKEILKDAGYERYEISNYAKPGYECRHNLGYWERTAYLGFGIGAASLVPGKWSGGEGPGKMSRYSNPDTIQEYAKSFRKKFGGSPLSQEEEMEEFMFLGLRKIKGIEKQDFEEYFGVKIEAVYGTQIERLKTLHLLEEDNERIWLTEKGIDVSNMVFVEFMF